MQNEKLNNNEIPLHRWMCGNIIHTAINVALSIYLILKLWLR